MPRTGYTYSLPAGGAVAGAEAKAADVTTPLDDLAAEQNRVRPVSAGGTGGSTAAGARTALSAQEQDDGLDSIAGLTTSADKMIYTTANDTYATTDLTSAARDLLDDTTTAAMRTTLGGEIGTDVQAFAASLTGRNLLINSRGAINQRGYVSGTATTGDNEYTLDRWRVIASGKSLSFTMTEGTATFTAPTGGVEQEIEGGNIISGTYVISFTGTASCRIYSHGGFNFVDKKSGDTVTLIGGTNTVVKFYSGTFSLPQLELGSTATPFELRPEGVELELCQRYCLVLGTNLVAMADFGGRYTRDMMLLPTTMRTTPSLSYTVTTLAGSISSIEVSTHKLTFVSGAGTGFDGSIDDLILEAEL